MVKIVLIVLAIITLISIVIGQFQGPEEDNNPDWCDDPASISYLNETMGYWDATNYLADHCNN